MAQPSTSDPAEEARDGELQAVLDRIKAAREAIVRELRKVIVGEEEPIDQVLAAILAGGHCMIQGPPGTAKTILIASLAKVLDLQFKRIQFTPDLMPSDISGTEILEEDTSTGHRFIKFVKGPVFCNIMMADEINRTPPKTQAALLEVMQEKQVTIGGKTNPLPSPHYVLATQITLEQEGTYPLPEAQQDRFMLSVAMSY
ncbi:MAG: AAA family ATPase, partial [Phycisphaerae bacterium]